MRRVVFATAGLAALLLAPATQAADHLDSPAAASSPAADITDVYAWMNNGGTHLNLVMDVVPIADTSSAFSDAIQYVFHVDSGSQFGSTTKTTDVIVQFDAAGDAQVWVGNSAYLGGDVSDPAGLGDDTLRVFAGLRNDPFYFNFEGFNDAVGFTVANAGGLTFDSYGCPDTTGVGLSQIVARLQGTNNGADAAEDFFAGLNVLSIVVQVDVSLVNGGGDTLAVWGSTHNRP